MSASITENRVKSNLIKTSLVLASVLACQLFGLGQQTANAQSGSVRSDSATKTSEKPTPIKQKPDALLAGIQKAISYSGYRAGQHPDRGEGAINPSEEELLEDLQLLSRDGNFQMIRLYDSQENSEAVLRLIKQHDIDLKVMLGAWLSAEVHNPACTWLPKPFTKEALATNKQNNAKEVARAIRLANEYPDIVVAVAVGNEALVSWTDHMVPIDSAIAYIRQVKKGVSQPVTVADNHDWWAKEGAPIAKEVDFLSVHIYPIWEGQGIDTAIAYGKENLQAIRDALPESQIVITEAGWATIAGEFGRRADEENQLTYYEALYDWTAEMNITTFFFEAFDESWKGDPDSPWGAEKHWGIFTEDRVPKLVMHDLYPELMP